MLQMLASGIMPHLVDLLATILAALVGAVLLAARQYLTTKIGATATASLSDMLHRALETGVKAAITANPSARPGDLIRDAITHAEASIPDTLAKLAPTPETLANIARSKLVGLLR